MTFDEIVAEVMSRLNLQSSDARIRIGHTLNTRYKRVTSAIGLVVARRIVVSGSTIPGNPSVQFQGIEKVIAVFDESAGSRRVLGEATFAELRDGQTGSGTASRYAIARMGAHHVEILLDAIPQVVKTYKADGHERAQTLAGTMEPAFPESFHDVLVEGVLVDELRKQEKKELAAFASDAYERRLSDLRMWIAKSGYLLIRQGQRWAGETSATGGAGGGGGGGGGGGEGSSYIQTGLVTFDRDPQPPFAVTPGSGMVPNLDADRLDGQDGAAYHDAAQLTGQLSSFALLPSMAPGRLLGRDTASPGTPIEILVGANLLMSGNTLSATGGGGGGGTLQPSRLLGRGASGGIGTAEEIQLGPTLAMVGTVLDATTASINETITGLKTFNRSPAPPFAVTVGSATVANLDADKLDGIDSTTFARKDQANVFTANQTMPSLEVSGSWIHRGTNQNSFLGLTGSDGNGARLVLYGPAAATQANLIAAILPAVAGAEFVVQDSAGVRFLTVRSEYMLVKGPVNTGNDIIFTANCKLRLNTGAGADNGYLFLCGGGDSAQARGAHILVTGKDYGGAPGVIYCYLGNHPSATFNVIKGVAGSSALIISETSTTFWVNPVSITPTIASAATAFLLDVTNVANGSNGYYLQAPAAWTGSVFIYYRGAQPRFHVNHMGVGTFGNSTIQIGQGFDMVGGMGATDGCIYAPTNILYLQSAADIRSFTIYNTTDSSSANMVISSTGRIARFTSSKRYKTAIAPLDDWRWLLDLTPITFDPIEHPGTRRYAGLLAEDVAALGPQAYGRPIFAGLTPDGLPDDVAYDHLHAPVILAIQNLHARLRALEGTA